VLNRRCSARAARFEAHDGGELLRDPGELGGVSYNHAEEPEVFGALAELQDHARDQAQHVLDVALRFDTEQKCVLELTRPP
jgi:hypothetical protein